MKSKIMLTCLLYSITNLPSQTEPPLSYAQITVANISQGDLDKIKTQHQYDILKNYSNTLDNNGLNNKLEKNRAWRATEYSWSAYPQSQGYIDPKIASPEFFNMIYAIYESELRPKSNNSSYMQNKNFKSNGSF
ncbi:MAG: hypothetical protein ACXWL2_02845 [Candidatus Chromulinivorax sp.]